MRQCMASEIIRKLQYCGNRGFQLLQNTWMARSVDQASSGSLSAARVVQMDT
jgi:hypothetical protein